MAGVGPDGFYLFLQPIRNFRRKEIRRLDEVFGIPFFIGLPHPVRQVVVKTGDALAAVLVVLVGLDRDAAEGRVGGDILGLPQVAVAGREAAGEKLMEVDLGAGGGQGQEVEVVDMDVPVDMGPARAPALRQRAG